MLRLIIITLLVLQALAAQAGVAGVPCEHAFLKGSATTDIAAHNHDTSAIANGSQEHDRCCCDVVGHCSASAIGVTPLATDGHVMNPTHPLPLTGASIARGFTTTPYRPPSSAA